MINMTTYAHSTRLNLGNCTFRVGINANPPYVFQRFDDAESTWKIVGGLEVKLLDTMQNYFNFSYHIVNLKGNWGKRLSNGTWVGLIGKLEAEQLDFGIGGTTLNYERSQVVPYLYPPHIRTSVGFITSAPQQHDNVNLYLEIEPFDDNIWLMLGLSLLACLIFDYIYRHVERVSLFWISIYSLLKQSYHHWNAPTTVTFRVWSLTWNFSTLVLTAAYAGCLYSMITVPHQIKTIDTIKDLYQEVESKKMIVFGLPNSGHIHMMNTSNIEMYRKIVQQMKPVANKTVGFGLVKNRGKVAHAFISLRDSLEYGQLIYGIDRIHLAPDHKDGIFYENMIGIPVRPSFPYIEQFSDVLYRLVTSGLVDYWKKVEYLKIQKWYRKEQTTNVGFTLEQIQSFFYSYLASVLISTVVLSLELVYFHTIRSVPCIKSDLTLFK